MKNPEEAKKAIIQAAIDEIAEIGISKVRTQKIALRANVATGLLHYHFKTKENLLIEIAKMFTGSSLINDIIITPFHRKCNPLEKIQTIIYAILEITFKKKTGNLIRFYNQLFSEGREFVHKFLKNYDFYAETYVLSIINEGIETGIFQMNYPEYFFYTFYDSVIENYSSHQLLEGIKINRIIFPEPYPESFIQYITEASIRSLVTPKKLHEIKPLPEELKSLINSYINIISQKIMIISPHLMLKIIAKLFNDNPNKQGEYK